MSTGVGKRLHVISVGSGCCRPLLGSAPRKGHARSWGEGLAADGAGALSSSANLLSRTVAERRLSQRALDSHRRTWWQRLGEQNCWAEVSDPIKQLRWHCHQHHHKKTPRTVMECSGARQGSKHCFINSFNPRLNSMESILLGPPYHIQENRLGEVT